MEGEYDSYGRVFTEDAKDSLEWETDWNKILNYHFDDNVKNGIAAIHSKCYNKEPVTISEDDPNQGRGENWEYFGDIESDTKF